MGIMGGLPEMALAFQATGEVKHAVASGVPREHAPRRTIRFSVIGLDHSHINGITDTIRRNGGELVSVYSTNTQALAAFQKRYAEWETPRLGQFISIFGWRLLF